MIPRGGVVGGAKIKFSVAEEGGRGLVSGPSMVGSGDRLCSVANGESQNGEPDGRWTPRDHLTCPIYSHMNYLYY